MSRLRALAAQRQGLAAATCRQSQNLHFKLSTLRDFGFAVGVGALVGRPERWGQYLGVGCVGPRPCGNSS